ncbi:hypothetical protein GDO81_020474 [Engystomops pustulosus]|uniref:Uncharacterized protein n=1 Tax=Engystomops pustulosus TaxID=76066 RepID=A0AAV6ZEB8_ENGPU|nr:hypothetical protein GDO81_020474 [Engystomops pustulosus]
MVHDLRADNECTDAQWFLIHTPHWQQSLRMPYSSLLFDLANVFLSLPLHEDCQYLFTFTSSVFQYIWCRFPQRGGGGKLHTPRSYRE